MIVPGGAKGGFVLKRNIDDREARQVEAETCYRKFISGLLDVTDNLVDGEPVPPPDVVCHDDPDPYLVVAADKGTATFSDLANAISTARDFWLGDAFASGGSAGYTTRKWASPRAAPGMVSAISGKWTSTSRKPALPLPGSGTCRATSSATACCARPISGSSRRLITATSSSIPTPTKKPPLPSASAFLPSPGQAGRTTTRR